MEPGVGLNGPCWVPSNLPHDSLINLPTYILSKYLIIFLSIPTNSKTTTKNNVFLLLGRAEYDSVSDHKEYAV